MIDLFKATQMTMMQKTKEDYNNKNRKISEKSTKKRHKKWTNRIPKPKSQTHFQCLMKSNNKHHIAMDMDNKN